MPKRNQTGRVTHGRIYIEFIFGVWCFRHRRRKESKSGRTWKHAERESVLDTGDESQVHDVVNNMRLGLQTDICVLDFSKAFDKVGHRRLVEKLRMYGETNTWIEKLSE